MLLRGCEPRSQMGPGAGNDSLRAGTKRIGAGNGGTMKKLLQEAILERPLLCDGAMGTQLMLAGLEQGNCGEAWNLTHPERVLAIQRRYAEAGVGVHHHQHVWRIAHHAQPPFQGRPRGGDQQGGRGDRAREPLATETATCSATSGRSAGCWRLLANSLKPRCEAHSRSRPRHWWMPEPTPSSLKRRHRSRSC